MKFHFCCVLALAISGIACAQPQKKCFVSGGLKDEVRVYLSINGIQVAGEFFMARGYDAASREIHVFGGTKAGNNLSVKFAAGKTPRCTAAKQGKSGVDAGYYAL